MKVTVAMVTSLDGKTTKGNKPGARSWASPEDQAIFQSQIAAHDCLVMGSTTYEEARPFMKPSADKLRIVLTRTPEKFAEDVQPGLMFSSDSPQEIIKQAANDGHQSLLLVGGATTNARFFDAGLVDEILVTVEPLLFGDGMPLVTALQKTIQLQLAECTRLNDQGTLLLRYIIQKT